jgi:hypothetical protein
MPDVMLATCRHLPSGDEDADLLTAALGARGLTWRWAVWDDPDVAWEAAGLVVIRSTWDYPPRRDMFLAWVATLPRVANDAHVVRWNSDKIYLRDLASSGVPIVPTSWGDRSAVPAFPAAGHVVVKPSVGAGSRGTGRFDLSQPPASDAARRHVRLLRDAGRTVLVQPYLADVDEVGETSLIYLDGVYSHAIRKDAMLPRGTVNDLDFGPSDELFVQEHIAARTSTADETAVGAAALEAIRTRFGSDQLYARVDLLPSPAGPVLIELELIEPSLFLGCGAGSVDRLAAAIAARVG